MSTPRIGVEERRRRLAVRHHLHPARPASSPVEAARRLVGLHSSDPASVFMSAWARTADASVADLEHCLYDRPSLFRVLGMRRTLFAVPADLVPLLHHGCARPAAGAERKRLIGYLEQQGITDQGEAWLERVMEATAAAVSRRGEAAAMELRDDVPELRLTLTFGEGKKWGGRVGVSTRVLFLLAAEGRIVRGRPRGTWISGQYRWAAVESRIPGGIPGLDPAEARIQLVERWLRAYGPGTEADLKWWTGRPLREVRKALAALDAAEVEIEEEGPGFVSAGDLEPAPPQPPWANLTPPLDPTVMGWRSRNWYLGEHRGRLFDRNGNAGPAVWWNGRVVGGWAQTPGGAVVYRLLEDIGAEGEALADERAAALEEWLGGVRPTPRFRTPLEKELSR